MSERYDVVILGGGLAGLSVARQILLNSEKRILLVDRKPLPPTRQKVGEATVQVSGYYFSRVLDLEEHLLREHFLKYNLRFYWKTPGRENRNFEDFSQAYIRKISNVPTYQLDRNKLEAEILRLNCANPRFRLVAPAEGIDVELTDGSVPHAVRFTEEGREERVEATWVVDASGRGKALAKKLKLERKNPIRHGTSYFWVDGLVDIDKLTDSSPREIRVKRDRMALGHLPFWLATNHFCGEGFWFWTIPLQGKTSLGLVYDNTLIPREEVATPEKLIAWICREFPLFERDLPHRKVVDWGGYRDFSFDCAQTISPAKWALCGEAGRFTDPLYSPGGDLISIYNTLIADAILNTDDADLLAKTQIYEELMRAVYSAYVPSFAVSYDTLGDPEPYVLKYTWELTVYFAMYVFPFINDLFTDRRFILTFLVKFAQLGPVNQNLQTFLHEFYQWKKGRRQPLDRPVFFDFTDIAPLAVAETTFYEVGVTVDEAKEVLAKQMPNLMELARYVYAWVSASVLQDERVVTNHAFVEGIDLKGCRFDPEEMAARWAACRDLPGTWEWSFDPLVMSPLRTADLPATTEEAMEPVAAAAGGAA